MRGADSHSAPSANNAFGGAVIAWREQSDQSQALRGLKRRKNPANLSKSLWGLERVASQGAQIGKRASPNVFASKPNGGPTRTKKPRPLLDPIPLKLQAACSLVVRDTYHMICSLREISVAADGF
eukprot:3363944-Amphidinium_carterae.2